MSRKPRHTRALPSALQQGWRLLICPVWNRETHRLRAPLRAILPLVMTFLALGFVQTVVRPRFDHPMRELLELSLMGVVLLVSVLISARLFDRRPVAEYGLAFVVGGLVATIANAGTMLVALAVGWATVSGFTQGSDALPFLPAMLLVLGYVGVLASWEEFVFRGAMLKNLAEGADGCIPRWGAVGLAVVLSTLIFAFMHGGKVGDPTGYAYYVLSGDLALPVGFHVFYNFTMSAVFGLGVSQRTPELIALNAVGPAFWIGEEGLLRIIFAVVGGVLLLAYIRLRDGTLRIDDRVTHWTPTGTRDASDAER